METPTNVNNDNRRWLENFLYYGTDIDPHDDQAYVTDALMPYAALLRGAHVHGLKEQSNDILIYLDCLKSMFNR